MRTGRGDFDLLMTRNYCDIVADDIALLLPITMTLEECIDMCCESAGVEFREITQLRDTSGVEGSRNCEGEYTYVY